MANVFFNIIMNKLNQTFNTYSPDTKIPDSEGNVELTGPRTASKPNFGTMADRARELEGPPQTPKNPKTKGETNIVDREKKWLNKVDEYNKDGTKTWKDRNLSDCTNRTHKDVALIYNSDVNELAGSKEFQNDKNDSAEACREIYTGIIKCLSKDELTSLGLKERAIQDLEQSAMVRAGILKKVCNHIVERAQKAEENSKIIENANGLLTKATNSNNKSQVINAEYVKLNKDGSTINKTHNGEVIVYNNETKETVCYKEKSIKVQDSEGKIYEYKNIDYDFDAIKQMADEAYKTAGANH